MFYKLLSNKKLPRILSCHFFTYLSVSIPKTAKNVTDMTKIQIKYDAKPTYKKFLGYRPGVAVIGDILQKLP